MEVQNFKFTVNFHLKKKTDVIKLKLCQSFVLNIKTRIHNLFFHKIDNKYHRHMKILLSSYHLVVTLRVISKNCKLVPPWTAYLKTALPRNHFSVAFILMVTIHILGFIHVLQSITSRTTGNYSTALNFGVLPLVEIGHVTRQCLSSAGTYQRIVPVFGNFRSTFSVAQ